MRLRIFRVAEACSSRGVETRIIDGMLVRITTVARMLVDCFKRRTNAVAALTRKELVQKGTDQIDHAERSL